MRSEQGAVFALNGAGSGGALLLMRDEDDALGPAGCPRCHSSMSVHVLPSGAPFVTCSDGCRGVAIELIAPATRAMERERLSWTLGELVADGTLLKPPRAILPGVAFAGRSTLLAGREKGGKSTFAAAGAAAVSRGAEFLGERCEEGVVLWVGLEEHTGDVVRRFLHFNGDPERLHIAPRLPGGVADLRALVDELQPVLVVVDTLAALAHGAVDDFNAAAQWLPLITALTELAHDTGCALALLHHAAKSTGRYRDSTAIGGGVDAIVELADPEKAGDPTRRELRARGRMSLFDFGIRFDGQTFTRIDAGNALPLEIRVLDYVRANPGCSKESIVRAVGGRAKNVRDAITTALDRRLFAWVKGRGCYVPAPALPLQPVPTVRPSGRGVNEQDEAGTSSGRGADDRPPDPRPVPIGTGGRDEVKNSSADAVAERSPRGRDAIADGGL